MAMRNITKEAQTQHEKEMPTFAEFGSAKLREGFDVLGNAFNKKKNKAKLKLDVLGIEGELRKLATHIGTDIIKQIANGSNPGVNEVFVEEANALLAKKAYLEGLLNGGAK